MKLKNEIYDILKWIAVIFLPAFTTLIGVIGTQYGYDMSNIVVTLTAVDTFIGTLIGVSTKNYRKEDLDAKK